MLRSPACTSGAVSTVISSTTQPRVDGPPNINSPLCVGLLGKENSRTPNDVGVFKVPTPVRPNEKRRTRQRRASLGRSSPAPLSRATKRGVKTMAHSMMSPAPSLLCSEKVLDGGVVARNESAPPIISTTTTTATSGKQQSLGSQQPKKNKSGWISFTINGSTLPSSTTHSLPAFRTARKNVSTPVPAHQEKGHEIKKRKSAHQGLHPHGGVKQPVAKRPVVRKPRALRVVQPVPPGAVVLRRKSQRSARSVLESIGCTGICSQGDTSRKIEEAFAPHHWDAPSIATSLPASSHLYHPSVSKQPLQTWRRGADGRVRLSVPSVNTMEKIESMVCTIASSAGEIPSNDVLDEMPPMGRCDRSDGGYGATPALMGFLHHNHHPHPHHHDGDEIGLG